MRTHRLKKFVLVGGIAFAVIGAILTLVVLVTATWEAFPFSFDFGVLVIAVPAAVGIIFGIPKGTPTWVWVLLSIITNGSLCILFGAFLGFLAWLVTKPTTKANDSAAYTDSQNSFPDRS